MSQETNIDAKLLSRKRKRRSTAFISDALASVVGLLPSYRNTARGRKFATQARVATIAAGLIVVVFAGHPWLFVGIVLMAGALVAPMPEMKKRTLLSNLKKRRYKWTEKRSPVVIIYDGKRIITREGTTNIHKFTPDPDSVTKRAVDDKEAIVIQGGSSRKSDRIVLRTSQHAKDLQNLDRDSIEILVDTDRATLDPLLDRLEQS